ncbi:unnamed protein product [Rotaria socialis]|uniref:Uncharacterized protein n=1 Tax=Rotaria socialis TaxID=392032 RepID=A0A821CY81_9BILA|nr:unnamed protein product [Rotaria socialis]CAF4522494.1 unnamed protein product [Rotaria socialis]CAF4613109.1 unnamed protein product [Rotaria socialis]CAF4811545.1 unnamed protein product [Rotaria socialis]
MCSKSFFLDTSRLPDDVLSYTDEAFYNFVEVHLGRINARLLSYLQISSVPCFLLTENPCEILTLDIDDEVLEQMSQEICIKLKNSQVIVKPGIENCLKCLKNLLLRKIEEEMKKMKLKGKQQFMTFANTTPVQSIALSTSISASSTSLLTTPCSPSIIDEHRQYLLKLIHQWCIDNRAILELNELELKEDVDFNFAFSNINNALEINIQCKCGSKLILGKNAGKFQLSNYYKHLKDTNCLHIKALKKRFHDQAQSQKQLGINSITTSSVETNSPMMTVLSVDAPATTSSPIVSRKKGIDSDSNSPKKKIFAVKL